MKEQSAKVISNDWVAKGIFLMELLLAEPIWGARPGQFIMLKVATQLDPLLRRPFSIYQLRGQRASILYKVAGRGTRIMSCMEKGQEVSILGPLGNAFVPWSEQEYPILVAGGIGIAGLEMLREEAGEKGIAVLGFKGRDEIPYKILPKKGVIVTTEDGTEGTKGTVIEGVKKALASIEAKEPIIYACGSPGMLKAVCLYAASMGLRCQVLMESFMACGVGACQGCAVKTVHGYKRVCKDGPVFWGSEIQWK